MSDEKYNFIVIDDSKLDCFIAEKIIRNTGRSQSVQSFTQATDALAFVQASAGAAGKTVLLVDIQMPIMNGFEFVEAFEKLPAAHTANYIIYVLSSSINENDLVRARSHVSVRQFINKPLTAAVLAGMLDGIALPAAE